MKFGRLCSAISILLVCFAFYTVDAEWHINPRFSLAFSFKNDVAKVKNPDGKTAVIDRNGEYLLGPANVFEECPNGLYLVSNDSGKCAYFNKHFVQLTEYTYENFASLEHGDGKSVVIPFYRDGKYGIMNDQGKEIVSPTFIKLNHFRNGTAVFVEPDEQWKGDNHDPYMGGRCGLVDEKGNIIVPAIYYSVDNISHPDYIYASGAGSYVTYDKSGNVIRDELTPHNEPIEYADGYVNEYRDGKDGVTAPDGTVIVPYVFSKGSIKKFGNLFVAGGYYVYDRSGNIIFEAYPGCGIHHIGETHNFYDVDYLMFSKIEDDGTVLYGLMDFDGNIVCEPQYILIQSVAGGRALYVLEGDRYYYTDLSLNEISYENYRKLLHEACEGLVAENASSEVVYRIYGYVYDDFELSYKSSEWAKTELAEARTAGIKMPLVYDFTKSITRVQFCEAVYSAIKDSFEFPQTDISFDDTENEAVKKLAAAGIIDGKADGIFAPFDLLTREEAAKILSLTLEFAGKEFDMPDFQYTDSEMISYWAKEHVIKLNAAGIMHGVGENIFEPKGNLSCEQAVAMVLRMNKN